MKYCEGKTMCFRKPSVIAYAAVVGKAENEGPYGGEFDEVVEDNKAGSDTWEQAESLFQQRAVGHVLRKSGLEPDRIDLMIAGDLLNQCVGSSYGLKDYFIPYLGIYGACSTFAEGLLLSAALVNAGYIDTAIASTSSHFSTAERQFRFPLNPTSAAPFIRAATVGKIEDMGITDLNNMGAAMAGAAYDTLTRHMKHRGTHPQDYDVIITGDLGQVGSDLLYDLFQRDGVSLREHHKDCGLMIYDRAAQDVHAGGSGCGCSASMMCGHFFKRIQAGELKRVLYCATGALMSPTVVQQGGSIPGIAHCVEISSEAGG